MWYFGSIDIIQVAFPNQSEPVGGVVYTVFASDPDLGSGGNFYFILNENDNETFQTGQPPALPSQDGHFMIGYLTGNIELHRSLDHESDTTHVLSVSIVDEGNPPLSTHVTITVNVTNTADAAPVFGQKFYFTTIPEGVYNKSVSEIYWVICKS